MTEARLSPESPVKRLDFKDKISLFRQDQNDSKQTSGSSKLPKETLAKIESFSKIYEHYFHESRQNATNSPRSKFERLELKSPGRSKEEMLIDLDWLQSTTSQIDQLKTQIDKDLRLLRTKLTNLTCEKLNLISIENKTLYLKDIVENILEKQSPGRDFVTPQRNQQKARESETNPPTSESRMSNISKLSTSTTKKEQTPPKIRNPERKRLIDELDEVRKSKNRTKKKLSFSEERSENKEKAYCELQNKLNKYLQLLAIQRDEIEIKNLKITLLEDFNDQYQQFFNKLQQDNSSFITNDLKQLNEKLQELEQKKIQIEDKDRNNLLPNEFREESKSPKASSKALGVYKCLKSIENTMQLVLKGVNSRDHDRYQNISNIFGTIQEIIKKFDPSKGSNIKTEPDLILHQINSPQNSSFEANSDRHKMKIDLRLNESQQKDSKYEESMEISQNHIEKLKQELDEKTKKLIECEKTIKSYKQEIEKASNSDPQGNLTTSPKSIAPRGFPSISKGKKLQTLEKELQKKNEELKEMQKKVDQYYGFNQLLIRKQEEATANMNKICQQYEQRILELNETLKNYELKIEELTEIARTSQEALIVNTNNNKNNKSVTNTENAGSPLSPNNDLKVKYEDMKEMLMHEKKRAGDLESENIELNHIINDMMKHKDHFDELIQKKENEIIALKQQVFATSREKIQSSDPSINTPFQKKIKSPRANLNPRNLEEFNMLQTNNQYLQSEIKKLKSNVNYLKLKNSELTQSNQRCNAEALKVKEERDIVVKSLRSENDKLNKMIGLLQEQVMSVKQKSTKFIERSA